MRRVHNSDIEFKLDKKIINVTNFSMKFYTVNPDNFFVKKTNDDVYEKERPVTIEDVEAIESGLTSVTEYYVALDWAELVNIGRGVMNYQAINNYNIGSFVDLWYNNSVTRTTEYYIDSDIVFSDADGRNVIEKVDDLGKDLDKEIQDRISADLVLSDRIDYIVEHMDSGGTIDPTRYYLKTETSGATELATAFAEKQDTLIAGDNITISGNVISAVAEGTDLSNYYTKTETSGATEIESALETKLDTSAYTPTDLTNYYTKSETSGATEIATALEGKLDTTAYTPTDLTNYYTKSETSGATEIATALGNKLDSTAYTPTDLTDYYTKSETSGKSEIATALEGKQDTLIAGDNITISGNVISAVAEGTDLTNYYTKSETSGKSEIATALEGKLDTTAYTPTDLTDYYTKSETSGKTEIANALNDKADNSNTYTKSETSGATEIASALNAKLDTTAYTPTDLSNYYTKSQTSGASEISTALGTKLDSTAYTPTDLTNYYTKSETSGATEISTALNAKADTLVSGTNIKTINNESILGDGNIDIQGGGKAVSGGTNISITTGETADTINCTLPISGGSKGIYTTSTYPFGGNAFKKNNVVFGDNNSISKNGSSSFVYYNFMTGRNNSIGNGEYNSNNMYSNFVSGEDNIIYPSANSCSAVFGGNNTIRNYYEFATGKYNNSNTGNTRDLITLFSVGNGTANNARHNAFEIRQNGDIYCSDGTNDVKLQDTITATAANTTALGGLKLQQISQSDYDNLGTYDNSTLYVIVN